MNQTPTLTRGKQIRLIVAMYAGYAMFMVLRMAPGVATSTITGDPELGIDLGDWGRIMAVGTIGAVIGKFIGGFAADRLGGRLTFAIGLVFTAIGIGAFGVCTEIWMFQAALFVALMAKSAGWPAMAKIIVDGFRPTEYGRVWGILATSSRVGTLIATFALGALLAVSARQPLFFATAIAGIVMAVVFFLAIGSNDRNDTTKTVVDKANTPEQDLDNPYVEPKSIRSELKKETAIVPHPLDGTTLMQAIGHFCGSGQFWLIVCSLMGLSIMWDFLLLVPVFLEQTLGIAKDKAAMSSSAFPFGSLISVLAGGFVFDKLNRKSTAWVMAFLLAVAAGCIFTFYQMPRLNLADSNAVYLSIALLFVFGLCVSPCYYIPMSVFSIEFGGPHSGFLIALLDAIAFGATAAFYFFAGEWAQKSWGSFLLVMLGVAIWAMLTTCFFMLGEASKKTVSVT